MKKIVLGTSLVLAMVLGSGCGDSDSKKSIDDVVVDFKNAATYNLSEYVVPSQAQTNNYAEKVFKNSDGKKKYDAVADEENFTSKVYDINGSTVRSLVGGQLDESYTTVANKINQVDDDGLLTQFARYADTGDYISKVVRSMSNGLKMKQACKLNKKIDSKVINNVTYSDILEVVCTVENSGEGTTLGQTFKVASDGEIVSLFAKGEGMISTISEGCTKTTLGSIEKETCEKSVETITNILKN